MTENERTEWHHQLGGREFEQASGIGDGQGSLACCSPWGHKELDMTEQLNNNKQIALATTDILMILILLIYEHGYVSIYLCHPQFLLSVS